MIEPTIHMHFGQLGKAADALIVDKDLRNGARAIRDLDKFRHCGAIQIDTDFVKRDAAFVEKHFGLLANWASAGAVYLDFIHGGLRWDLTISDSARRACRTVRALCLATILRRAAHPVQRSRGCWLYA